MNDQEMNEIILGAFVKAKWLHKYLPFEFHVKWNQTKSQGITNK